VHDRGNRRDGAQYPFSRLRLFAREHSALGVVDRHGVAEGYVGETRDHGEGASGGVAGCIPALDACCLAAGAGKVVV
jgi:hypothetical protein